MANIGIKFLSSLAFAGLVSAMPQAHATTNPSWMEVIDFTSNSGTRFDSGASCNGDGILNFGNCQDLRYNRTRGNILNVSALSYSSLADTTGSKSYVENYDYGGIKGLGVDSGNFTDARDSVDDYESLVFTFNGETTLLGWNIIDTNASLIPEANLFRIRVDGGSWMEFNIGNRSVQEDPLLKGFKFEFQSKNDSFVVQSLVVPEPETIALALAGLAVLGVRRVKNGLSKN